MIFLQLIPTDPSTTILISIFAVFVPVSAIVINYVRMIEHRLTSLESILTARTSFFERDSNAFEEIRSRLDSLEYLLRPDERRQAERR